MKTKSFFTILFGVLLLNSYNAQIPDEPMTISQYPAFYNETVQKMNNIIPNKTYYYGKPLSVFLTALAQNSIIIKSYNPGPFDNKFLKFAFVWNMEVESKIWRSGYVEPYIYIYFQQPFIYQQAEEIMKNGYYTYWNPQADNFFKDRIVEKIVFKYVNGLTDKHSPDK